VGATVLGGIGMRDQPLEVSVDGEELVIRIGVDVVAFAANESDDFKPYDLETGDWVQKFKVTDPLEFSRDVKRAMLDEGEDGSTPLSRFLDKMNVAALEDGSTGIDFSEDK
jgi:hypothetical protein